MNRWDKLDRPLILASRSPRRKEILGNMGFAFTVHAPLIENEAKYINIDTIEESVQELARAKAMSVIAQFPSSLILGSDTVVVVDKQVIVKPVNYADAKSMLQRLSGRMHEVYSGVTLVCADINFEKTEAACTEVFFRKLSDWEIDEYLAAEEYSDKAGAYAIQGRAMTFVDKINGCFYNVMGLPISETISIFKAYTEFPKGSK